MSYALQWIVESQDFNADAHYNFNPTIAVDQMSGYIYVTYYTDGTVSGQTYTGGDADIVVFKLEPTTGHCLWVSQQPSFNTTASDEVPTIAIGSDGAVYVTYSTDGSASGQTNTGNYDIVVFKLDPTTGTCRWVAQQPSFNTSMGDFRPVIAISPISGSVYVAYTTDGGTASGQTNTGVEDIVVFKLDSNDGSCLWVQQQPTFNTSEYDEYASIAIDQAGYIYVSYGTDGVASGQTLYGYNNNVVFKLEPLNGECLWVTEQPSFNAGDDYECRITLDASNNLYGAYSAYAKVSGQTKTGDPDIVVFKLDTTDGHCLWVVEQPSFNTTIENYTPSIAVDTSGNITVTYVTTGTASGQTSDHQYEIVVFQLEPTNGQCLWVLQQPSFNYPNMDNYPVTAIYNTGDIYVTYNVYGPGAYSKAQSNWCVVVFKLSSPFPAISMDDYMGVITGSGMVLPGRDVQYTFTVRNSGNVALSDVTITDTLGNTVVVGSLAPYTSVTPTQLYPVTQAEINTGSIMSGATVTGMYLTNQVESSRDTSVSIPQVPSILLSKIVNSAGHHAGEIIQYTVSYTNDGNLTLTSVHLLDPLLGIDNTRATLLPTQGFSQIYNYTITEEDMERRLVTNVATVTGVDPNQSVVSGEVTVRTVPCVLKDTMILMADGQTKPIQDLQRGDLVMGSKASQASHQVARVCQNPIQRHERISCVSLDVNSLGVNCPNRCLLITLEHPIFYQGARRPAKYLLNLKGVKHIVVDQIETLYDLQFDHDGSYYANGVEIQSCSPWSAIQPLPQDLYFDPSMYSDERVWDSYDQPLPLEGTVGSLQ